MNNISSGSDERILPVEFLGCDFARSEPAQVLSALVALDQSNINRTIHCLNLTLFKRLAKIWYGVRWRKWRENTRMAPIFAICAASA